MKIPKLDSKISAAYSPAFADRNILRAKLSHTSASASTVNASGSLTAIVEAVGPVSPTAPNAFNPAAIDQYSSGAFSRYRIPFAYSVT